ncbi:MAG: hypothetical protein H7145_22180 [Akkermansiaceae bacterium]|nr:hypothetical protein [Armatimonadota bacterium]
MRLRTLDRPMATNLKDDLGDPTFAVGYFQASLNMVLAPLDQRFER